MKKFMLVLMVSFAVLSAAEPAGAGTSGQDAAYDRVLVLDNFDDADLSAAPEWWIFDALESSFVKATESKHGKNYLKLSGKAKSYYVGGMGFYFGRDAAQYDALVVDVKGNGAGSGIIRIQLFDDDNNTYQLEQDREFKPLYDDLREYELVVDWTGWRTIEVPFSRFADINPGVGDDIWNPNTTGGSGGLLHVQLIFSAPGAVGGVDIGLDNLRLVRNKAN
ncbi:MAG: hypothetical protein LBQ83_04800 [Candidatus Margulisbacteria bacterium]|jgi:hypothetical protein|nr:hypothetical protein [Candidatus Margulisiibacteriota bacterium]